MSRAYLTVALEMREGDPAPAFSYVSIMSSPPEGLTSLPGTIFSQIFSVEGSTFQEAQDRMMEIIMQHPGLKWVIPWVAPGREAHMARFDLKEEIKQRKAAWFGEPNAAN